MKRLIVFLLLAAFAVTSCSPEVQQVDVNLEQGEKDPENIEAFGSVKARDIINLTVHFTALVEKVNVVEGQRVKKDDAIITFDLMPLYQQIKEKGIEISSLKMEQEPLKRELEKQWTDIPEASKLCNDKKYAQVSYEEAVKERDIQKKILESGGISQYEYNEFEKSVESKKKILEEIAFEDNKAKYLFDETKLEAASKLRSIESKIAGVNEVLEILQYKLKKDYIIDNNIVANMENAVVYDIGCVPGDILTEGKKAASLMNLDSLYVEANVNEEFIKDVYLGADVFIIPEADKTKEYKGKVTSISQGAVNINGQTSIPVDITIDNIDEFLKPNFNVDIKIIIK